MLNIFRKKKPLEMMLKEWNKINESVNTQLRGYLDIGIDKMTDSGERSNAVDIVRARRIAVAAYIKFIKSQGDIVDKGFESLKIFYEQLVDNGFIFYSDYLSPHNNHIPLEKERANGIEKLFREKGLTPEENIYAITVSDMHRDNFMKKYNLSGGSKKRRSKKRKSRRHSKSRNKSRKKSRKSRKSRMKPSGDLWRFPHKKHR